MCAGCSAAVAESSCVRNLTFDFFSFLFFPFLNTAKTYEKHLILKVHAEVKWVCSQSNESSGLEADSFILFSFCLHMLWSPVPSLLNH